MNSRDFNKLLISLIGFNLTVLSVMVYGADGTDVNIGRFMGYPFPYYVPYPAAVAIAFLLFAIGISMMLLSGVVVNRRLESKAVLTSVIIAGASAFMTFLTYLHGKIIVSGGREDSYVIQLEAARELLKGLNPYLVNYSGVLLSRTAINKLTLIYQAGPPYNASHAVGFVSSLDYPAFSFIYYIPAVLLRIPGNVWDSAVLGAALAILYLRLRQAGRDLFPLVVASGALYMIMDPATFDPITGWLAPAILMVTFADNPVIAGVMIGLAASYRQYAAALAFVYFPLSLRRLGRSRTLKGVLSMLITAAIVNLPFLVGSPRVFVSDVLLPARLDLDLEGFGISSVYFISHLTLPRLWLDVTAVTTLIVGSAITYSFYDELEAAAFVFPALAFFIYPRPLYSYWLWFPFVGLLASLTNVKGDGSPLIRSISLEGLGIASTIAAISIYASGVLSLLTIAVFSMSLTMIILLPRAGDLLRSKESLDVMIATLVLPMGLGLVALAARSYISWPVVMASRAANGPPALIYDLSSGLPLALGSFEYGTLWPSKAVGLPLTLALAASVTSAFALLSAMLFVSTRKDSLTLLRAAALMDGAAAIPLLTSGPLTSLAALIVIIAMALYVSGEPRSVAASLMLGATTFLTPAALSMWIISVTTKVRGRRNLMINAITYAVSAAIGIVIGVHFKVSWILELSSLPLALISLILAVALPLAYITASRANRIAPLIAAIPSAVLGQGIIAVSLAMASLLD
ncbi:hypothetical protein ASAC_0436 [Acidilobus saccharovorans 345-15]|uniref:Uncharacterized protein n=1 Tax=Acidilobus saccharovorans (strain DSM 16705 / JCM 18335 / VKM B-2471 / 345-15) TaxID=666510 RepID=D9Q0K5_ACIS3|nr:hypothetical protein [Acidilobus saccharovorans]ADL18843.1 hypothetical protein ASAC_0436 [Acidilobus saccharovorans 345-15]